MAKVKKAADYWFDKLTNAEKAIWKMIYYHPTMFTNRTGALDLLFCCIGTGLEWINGEIKDSVDDNYLSCTKKKLKSFDEELYQRAYKGMLTNFSSVSGDISLFEKMQRERLEWVKSYVFYENCLAEHTQNNIEQLVTTSHVPKYFYPISKYSNIMRVPDDAKPDWIELAIEVCDLILGCDPTIHPYGLKDVNKNNIKLIKQEKPRLIELLQGVNGKLNDVGNAGLIPATSTNYK